MEIKQILEQVHNGEITPDEAERLIKFKPFDDISYAVIDYNRELRTGCPEVIYCEGKTPEQVKGIIANMLKNGAKNILGTRANHEKYSAAKEACPDAVYNEDARIITVINEPVKKKEGTVLILAAGTSDIAVCEEAAVTAEFLGNTVKRVYDVGVAGIHRLLSRLEDLHTASVIIVVAGMEGALASVVGGLTDKPVIAVPTSVGYGASFGGVAALLSMLNSCAGGIGVVNIDNGFGAAVLAHKINSLR